MHIIYNQKQNLPRVPFSDTALWPTLLFFLPVAWLSVNVSLTDRVKSFSVSMDLPPHSTSPPRSRASSYTTAIMVKRWAWVHATSILATLTDLKTDKSSSYYFQDRTVTGRNVSEEKKTFVIDHVGSLAWSVWATTTPRFAPKSNNVTPVCKQCNETVLTKKQ